MSKIMEPYEPDTRRLAGGGEVLVDATRVADRLPGLGGEDQPVRRPRGRWRSSRDDAFTSRGGPGFRGIDAAPLRGTPTNHSR